MFSKKVSVVSGGGGFIGHHLVKNLERNENVIVLDNFARGTPERLKDCANNVKVIRCDLTDYDDLKQSLSGYEINNFYHLAAINGTGNFYKIPLQIMDVGVMSCFNILKFSLETEISKIIVASSAEVYQNASIVPTPEDIPLIVPSVHNPRYSYALSKIYTEYYSYQFGKIHKKNISIFRPHNVYGPDMGLQHVVPQFIMEFLKNKSEDQAKIDVKGSLDAIRSFCYVDDIVAGIKLLSEKNDGVNVYNIGTNHKVSMSDLLDEISTISKTEYQINQNDNQHIGGTKLRCPDISKISELGFNPIYSLNQGLTNTYEWYENNYETLIKNKTENY